MHDAFISYSRRDAVFARALEKALERYRPPKELSGAPQRHLEVFRDEGDLTGVEYTASIERHLSESSKLIILCSPNARASPYVNDEIERFVRLRGAEHLVPVLASGIPDNEARPEQESERAFPKALCDVLTMPLAVSFRGFDAQRDRVDRGAFSDAWFGLLANLYGVSRAEIEQREIRRRARQRRITVGIVTGVIGSLAAALVVSLVFWKQAVEQRNVAELQSRIALSRQLAANSSQYTTSDPPLAMLLARESFATHRSPEARRALYSALHLITPFTLEQEKGEVEAAVFSPDGARLAAAFKDSFIRLYDVKTLRPIGVPWQGHTSWVNGLAFSPDGRTLASASTDKTLIVWDAERGVPLRKSARTEWDLVSVAFSPDGKQIATGGIDKHVLIWDAESLSVLKDLPGHEFAVNAVVFHPRKPLLAATSRHDIRLWNPVTGEPVLAPLQGHTGLVWTLAFTVDGNYLVSGARDTTIRFWNLDDGRQSDLSISGYANDVNGIAMRPDGTVLASGGGDAAILLWEIGRREPISSPLRAHTHWINSLAFDRSGTWLASTGGEGRLVLWSMNTLGARFAMPMDLAEGRDEDVIFDRNGRYAVFVTNDDKVQLWDLQVSPPKALTERLKLEVLGAGNSVLNVDRDGRLLALDVNGDLVIWSLADKRQLCRIKHEFYDSIRSSDSTMFSPDGGQIAMAIPGNAYALWRVSDCSRVTLGEVKHEDKVMDVRFSPDGKTIASNSFSRGLQLQDSATGQQRLLDTGVVVGAFAFSPDSRTIAASVEEGVQIYDVASGKPIGPLLAGKPMDVAYAPDGMTLAMVGNSGDITLWDVPTARPLGPPIEAGQGQLRQVVFTSDGKRLLTGGTDAPVRMWDLDPDSWMRKACALAHRDLTDEEWQRFVGTSAPRQKASSCR